MNYQDFIGCEIEQALNYFKENNIEYEIIKVNSKKEKFDKELITNVKVQNGKILLYVDKFLIQI